MNETTIKQTGAHNTRYRVMNVREEKVSKRTGGGGDRKHRRQVIIKRAARGTRVGRKRAQMFCINARIIKKCNNAIARA